MNLGRETTGAIQRGRLATMPMRAASDDLADPLALRELAVIGPDDAGDAGPGGLGDDAEH